MPDSILPDPVSNGGCVQEAVCIHTNKIYDSCKDKDCVNNLRVYPTVDSRSLIESATSLKAKCAELLAVDVTVEQAPFTNGCYSVCLVYYYKIIADTYVCGTRSGELEGLAMFNKRVILYGSCGGAKVFSSYDSELCVSGGAGEGLPEAIVEALDPMVLDIKIAERNCGCSGELTLESTSCAPATVSCDECAVPECIQNAFSSEIYMGDTSRRVLVTLGQFSIVRLERDAHLLIPVYDNCLPEKECTGSGEVCVSPCELFSRVEFPVDSFFPPMGSGNDCAAGTCGCNE